MARSSLAIYFEDVVQRCRGVALVQKRGYRRERRTYRQIWESASGFALELAARRIATGDQVMLWGANSAEWVMAFWGCILRGAVAVPMDNAAAPDFAGRVARDAGVKLIVSAREKPVVDATLPRIALEDLPKIVAPQRQPIFSDEPLTRNHIAQIIFTSGTTAEPRGVVITHENILANIEALESGIHPYLKYERFFHPLRFVNLLPLSHVFGQFLGIFVPPLLGATVVFEDTLNPAEVMRTIRRERATVLVAVPQVLYGLRGKLERDIDGSGLRESFQAKFRTAEGKKFLRRAWIFRGLHWQFGWKFWAIISGGATLSSATESFFNRLGYAVIQGYGLTETTSLVSVNHPFRVAQGSIGKVLPGREIQLADDGEIMVRSSSVAAGYWEGGALKPAEENGWLRTGDIGALDDSGNLYFKGRKKNVIVTPAGMNIYPEDLEAALRRDELVRDCVVVSVAREGNAEACAILIVKGASENPQSTAAAIIERANRGLAEYQRMRQWLVWPGRDFPRTSTGKPRTNLIAETARQALDSGRNVKTDISFERGAAASERTILENLLTRIGSRRTEGTAQISSATSSPPCPAPSALGTSLETDWNLSSLDRVELMSAIEDRFQVDLNETKFAEARTVADLERLLQGSAGQRSPFHYPRWTQHFPMTWIRLAIYYSLVWPATHVLAHPRVYGRENLRGVRGPLLIVSNHVTRRTDIGFILAALPPRLRHRLATTMGGETLQTMRHPPREWFFLKRWIYRLNYFLVVALFDVFPLPQRSGFRESFRFAGDTVDRGFSVVVFPEGELSADGIIAHFETGVGLLANNLNIPVLPMRIDGLWEVKQTGWRFARPGRIRVIIGAPISFAPGTAPEQIASELEARVRGL